MNTSDEIRVNATDISNIGPKGQNTTSGPAHFQVMRSTTFVVIGGKHFAITREDWDKIRALAPPDN